MPQFLYLVNLCHTMDDVPMGIFLDVDAAFVFARNLDWDVPEAMLQRLQLPGCSTPSCITVTTFKDREPISRVVVREFDDEDDGDDESDVTQPDPSLSA
jgi:hypothetical protein